MRKKAPTPVPEPTLQVDEKLSSGGSDDSIDQHPFWQLANSTSIANSATSKLLFESDQNLIHLSTTAKEMVKLQKKYPELHNIDLSQIIDVAQTELKTMNYSIGRVLVQESGMDAKFIEIKPI